jgi:two-component system chemotaxis response regulator CheB
MMIRILLVDDSALMRQVLRELLSESPDMQVVGEASNGKAGCEKNLALAPDLVIMDLDMPILDGVAATARMMAERPVPVFVFSASAESPLGFKALSAGACEVLRKPDIDKLNDKAFKAGFFAKLRAVTSAASAGARVTGVAFNKPGTAPAASLRAVVIGASTGGPVAVRQLLAALPADFPLGIALVQHLEDGFDEGYARWLDEACELKVCLAGEGPHAFQAGRVLVAPVNRHLVVRSDRLVLEDGPKVQNQRPSVDVLFRSAAAEYGSGILGVLLTGMGRDGADGCKQIVGSGGHTLVQDQESSAIFGMPKAAIEQGGASEILPLPEMAGRLSALARARGTGRL